MKRVVAAVVAFVMLMSSSVGVMAQSATVKPNMSGVFKTVNANRVIQFTAADFTGSYLDTNDPVKPLTAIQFLSLPTAAQGVLSVDTTAVSTSAEVSLANLDKLKFTPNATYVGKVYLNLKASNGELWSDTAVLEITVSAPVPAPIAYNMEFSMVKNTTLTEPLHAKGDDLEFVKVSDPANGTLTITTAGEFTYKPKTDFTGTDSFQFRVKNPAESNVAKVTITVYKTAEDIPKTVYVDMRSHWANFSASHLADLDLIMGEKVSESYFFSPQRAVTKQEFVLFVMSLLKIAPDQNPSSRPIFSDEDKIPDWFKPYAYAAYDKGLIKGAAVAGGTVALQANKYLNRAEAFTIMNNALDLKNTTEVITFSDGASVPGFAVQPLKNLVAYKIVTGSSNMIRPLSAITRGEVAELLYKGYKDLEARQIQGSQTASY